MSGNQSIEQLLKDSNDYDKDRQFMAANDLCSLLLKEGDKYDTDTQQKICNVFIKHLDDPSTVIQGNAVKCLNKVFTKLYVAQIKDVTNKLLDRIIKGEAEFRDVNATCLKTLIISVQDEHAETLCSIIGPRALQSITDNKTNVNVQEELLEILNQIIRRFTGFFLKSAQVTSKILNPSVLSKVLLQSVQSEKSSIRKKSLALLGSLSLVITYTDLKAITDQIQAILLNEQAQKKKYFYSLQALYSISKYTATKITYLIPEIIPLIIKDIENKLDEDIDTDQYEYCNDLIEVYLQTIETFTRRNFMGMQKYDKKIVQLLQNLVGYDPMGVTLEQKEDEDEEEWEDDFDQDDTSWKVRRAAVQLLESQMKARPELLPDISDLVIENTLGRLHEKDENVKMDVFSAISTYIKISSVVEESQNDELPQGLVRMKSNILNIDQVLESLVKHLVRVLSDKQTNSIKTVATQTLVLLSNSRPKPVLNDLYLFLPIFKKYIENDDESSDIKINILKALRKSLKHNDTHLNLEKYFQQILHLALKSIDNNYFGISSEGFHLLGILYAVFTTGTSNDTLNYSTYIQPNLQLLISKLNETNIDQEIKQAAISNIGHLFKYCSNYVDVQTLEVILIAVKSKIQNEVTRVTALKSVQNLPLTITHSDPRIIQQYNELTGEVSSLLQKQQRSLRIFALDVLKHLTKILRQRLSQDTIKEIFNQSSNLISNEDFQITQLTLELLIEILNVQPNIVQQHIKQVLQNIITLTFTTLSGFTQERVGNILQILTKLGLIQPVNVISELENGVNDNNIHTIAKAVGALATVLDNNSRISLQNKYIKQIQSGQEGNHTLLSLLIIGEIGKKIDFSSHSDITELLINQFKSKNEDIRSHSSTALGGISIGNPKYYIQIIATQIKESTQNKILLLHTLRELIGQSTPQIYNELKSIVPFLFECTNIQEESFRNMVAECLGKIATLNINEIAPSLLQNLNSTNDNTKYTVATSIKYLATKKYPLATLQPLLDKLIQLVNDQNHDVQRSAIISINQIVQSDHHALKRFDESFYLRLIECSKFREDLVKQIISGKFDFKVDEGLKLRQAAFTFFNQNLNTIYDRVNFNILVDEIYQGLDDQSEEIQNLALHILEKVIDLAQLAILGALDGLSTRIIKVFNKQKELFLKQQQTENTKELLQSILNCVQKIQKIPETEQVSKFNELSSLLQNDNKLKEFLDSQS